VAILDAYYDNFAKYGHEAKVYVIPDLKTPAQHCRRGYWPSINEQNQFLKRIGFPPEEVPLNSDNRRNVGYLMAYASGADLIISIDDDNYCLPDTDFIAEHSIVLQSQRAFQSNGAAATQARWFNNCRLICTDSVYPRGFPYFARTKECQVNGAGAQDEHCHAIRINAGMWLSDPDIDAITWLHRPPKARRLSGNYVLAADSWCPINSQNTGLHRDLIPAYYFLRMGHGIDRFGDIFQGYFALKCAKHCGFTARFGTPAVDHRRNSHNYMADAQKEMGGIALLEQMLPAFLEYKLDGSTVSDAYLSLAEFVESQHHPLLKETAQRMRLWVKACRTIG
jgi:hypothetical protein